jgi:hypothetical protein
MTNLLERAINTDDPEIAAKITQHALGIARTTTIGCASGASGTRFLTTQCFANSAIPPA